MVPRAVSLATRMIGELPENSREGLPLATATDPAWVEAAVGDLNATIADHAHCELKAASTALSLVGRYADVPEIVRDFTALAHEELRHFDRVCALLQARGGRLPKVAPDRYVKALKGLRLPRLQGSSALLDQLILCGFVEARSCERFRLLARGPLPQDLRAFYAELAGAEARHYELFFRHAAEVAGPNVTAARIAQFAALEAELVRSLPHEPRIH